MLMSRTLEPRSSRNMFQNVDYYTLLGVGRDASESEIRERFRALARDAHPDRAAAADKADAEAKFQELTRAMNVLTNPERRRAYDRDQSMPSARLSGDAVVQDYLEAAGNFALAAQRDPRDVRAHHYLGLASARAGDLHAAVKALEAAVALEPFNVPVLKDAGRIFRQAGLLAKAEKAFQDAVRWDPTAADARKAIDEIRAERAVRA